MDSGEKLLQFETLDKFMFNLAHQLPNRKPKWKWKERMSVFLILFYISLLFDFFFLAPPQSEKLTVSLNQSCECNSHIS